MSSYLITGASRGIGFALVKNLSANPSNTVIGLVRNPEAAREKAAAELKDVTNLHFLHGDLADKASLKAASEAVSAITGGSLDVLIANAAYTEYKGAFDAIGKLYERGDDALVANMEANFRINVVGNVLLFGLFLPMIRRGRAKKVVAISSAMSDIENLTLAHGMYQNPTYSISKVALNMAVAKFHLQYRSEGILFMAVCPGLVDTDNPIVDPASPEYQAVEDMFKVLASYSPGFNGLAAPDDSAVDVLRVIREADIEKNGGRIVSHFGNNTWV